MRSGTPGGPVEAGPPGAVQTLAYFARLNPMPLDRSPNPRNAFGTDASHRRRICVADAYGGQVPYTVFLFRKRLEGEDASLGCEGCRGAASSPSDRPHSGLAAHNSSLNR